MKITSVQDFKNKATSYLNEKEPILVTRHGKAAGLFFPLHDIGSIPLDIQQELLIHFGKQINASLEEQKVSEEEILEDFQKHKNHRR